MMIDQKLRELLDFSKNTDLQELVWEKKGAKISFRRAEGKLSAMKSRRAEDRLAVPEEIVAPPVQYIRSSMVGTFYRADAARRPPMVIEGTVVSSGQPVASIEAMKIRKDVVAQEHCRILKALVEDGHAVEYGQPLFAIEPANAEEGNGNV